MVRLLFPSLAVAAVAPSASAQDAPAFADSHVLRKHKVSKVVKTGRKYDPDPVANPELSGEAAADLCELPADWPATTDEDLLTSYFDCLTARCHDVDPRIFDDSGDISCSDVVSSGVPCDSTVPGSEFVLSFICPRICDHCADESEPAAEDDASQEVTAEDYAEAADTEEVADTGPAPDTEVDAVETIDENATVDEEIEVAPDNSQEADAVETLDENVTVDDEIEALPYNSTEADAVETIDENVTVDNETEPVPDNSKEALSNDTEDADEDAVDEAEFNVTAPLAVGNATDVANIPEEVSPVLTLELVQAPLGRVSAGSFGLSAYRGVAGLVRCGEEAHDVLVYLADGAPAQDGAVYGCAGACGEQDWSNPMKIFRIECGPVGSDDPDARRGFMTRAALAA